MSPAPTGPLQWHHQRLLSSVGPYASGNAKSYMQGRSAPTTPGILSRAESPTQSSATWKDADLGGSRNFTQFAIGSRSGATTPGAVPKSAGLADGRYASKGRQRRERERARLWQNRESEEWLYRHGVTLAGEARESKGQGWFVRRASSTDLATSRPPIMNVKDGGRHSASSNRSARTSRRGSKIGSQPNLTALGMTSALSTRSSGTALVSETGDYFGCQSGVRGVPGPDFVNGAEEEEDEDEVDNVDDTLEEQNEQRMDDVEVAKLTRESSRFGFGGFVDRVVGLSLFDASSDGGKKEQEEEELKQEEIGRLKRVRDSQRELARLVKSETRLTSETEQEEARAKEIKAEEEQEAKADGWSDAAWLLGVASKVLF